MTFLQSLNDYVPQLAIILLLVFFVGLRLGFTKGGWNRHLPYLFSLLIFGIYTLITPYFFFTEGRGIIIGTDITRYYGAGFFFNNIAMLSFIVSYWVNKSPTNSKWNQSPVREIKTVHTYIIRMFLVFYGISLTNLAVGGINITNVLFGNATVGLGAEGASYYLQNFSDSLICVLVLAYLFDLPKKKLVGMVVSAFFLFSILGFRYRIILSLLGFLFVYLYKNKVSVKWIVQALILGLVFFYAIMFSTVNRWVLVSRQYEKLEFNPASFDYSIFFEQTRGALPDMAVYKYYDNPNKAAEYDYGLTMFGYVFIRMIPRSIYPDKDRFYPPPQLATTLKAYDAYWARFSGEATLCVAAFYIAFGWLGIVFGFFIWGRLLRNWGDNIRKADTLQFASYIVIALVSFQWITRGYFPQIIDHAVYILFPIWVLRFFSKKKRLA